jgi:hypothetical protein
MKHRLDIVLAVCFLGTCLITGCVLRSGTMEGEPQVSTDTADPRNTAIRLLAELNHPRRSKLRSGPFRVHKCKLLTEEMPLEHLGNRGSRRIQDITLIPPGYDVAKQTLFPYANVFAIRKQNKTVLVHYCPKCREESEKWMLKHSDEYRKKQRP